jgi:hypothetical protein
MKRTVTLFAMIAVSAILSSAQDEARKVEVTGSEDLVQQKSSKWAEVWVHPDADISRYDNLYLWQTVFQFRDVSDNKVNQTTTAMLRGNQGYYNIPDSERSRFEEIVRDVVVKEINRSKQFEVVDTIGPRTLAIRAAVLDIVSNVPPNVNRQGDVYLSSMGEASFFFELIDAETGTIQARVGDRRAIQPPAQMNRVSQVPTTEATVWNNVEIWAQDQAMTLRREIDKLAKKAGKD